MDPGHPVVLFVNDMKYAKYVLIVLGVFLALLLALAGFAGYATCSESGLHWLTSQAERWSLRLGEVHGCLLNRLEAKDIRYSTPEMTVGLEQVEIAWHPSQLLDRRLSLTRIHLQGLQVEQQPSPEEKEEAEPFSLPRLPLAIEIADFRLREAVIRTDPKAEPVVIDEIVGRAQLTEERYAIDTLSVKMPGIQAALTGEVKPEGNFPLKLQGRWEVQKPDFTAQGEITGAGNLDRYEFNLKNALTSTTLPPTDVRLSAQGNRKELVLDKLEGRLLGGEIQATGRLRFMDKPLRFDLSGDWSKLAWPLGPQDEIKSPEGKFVLAGTPEDYQIQLSTVLAGTQIPEGRWTLAGQGYPSQFSLEKLRGELLDGYLEATGKADWQTGVHWDVRLDGASINPGLHWKEWPGALALKAHVPGKLEDGKLAISLENTEVSGKLRGYPFTLRAEAEAAGDEATVRTLELRSGNSQLQLQGHAGAELDLNWGIHSPNLAELYPKAKGRIKGEGRVSGPRTAPAFTVLLEGDAIAAEDLKLGRLAANVSLDLNRGQAFKIDLKAQDAVMGQRPIQSLAIQSDGTAASHRIRAALRAPDQQMEITAQGGVSEQRWAGQFASGSLADKVLGRWRLAAPTPLKLSGEAVQLGQFCWAAERGRWCLNADWRKSGQWRAEALVQDLALTQLRPLLPPEVTLEGAVTSELKASGMGGKPLEVNGDVRVSPGYVRVAQVGADPITVKYTEVGARIRLDQSRAEAEAVLALAQPGATPLRARLVLPPLSPGEAVPSTLPVRGEITGAFNDLSPFAIFAPEIEEVQGRLAIDLKISGTLAQPDLGGQLSLQRGAVTIPAAGIRLTEIDLKAIGEGRRIRLDGRMRSGEGHLQASGAVALDPAAPQPAQVKINGERFEAVNLPEAWALISPDLDIQAGKQGVNVTGKLLIPEAKLEPAPKESAIPVSEDVVVVPSPRQPPEKKGPGGVTAEIRVELGEKVAIKTKEFKSRLTGGLTVSSQPGQAPTGSGEIRVVEGMLSAYGQKLEIDKGRILFAGGPLEDPWLNIEAFRKVKEDNEEVLAGVKVQGLVSQPVLTLYSKPAMNQDQILAYLLFGKPLDRLSGDQGSALLGAAGSLGGENTEFLTQRIASTFGLEEVKLEGEDPKSMSLQMGKHLTPRLYMGYSAGLAGALGKLNLRYELTKSWLLQVESGTQMGVDLLYSTER